MTTKEEIENNHKLQEWAGKQPFGPPCKVTDGPPRCDICFAPLGSCTHAPIDIDPVR